MAVAVVEVVIQATLEGRELAVMVEATEVLTLAQTPTAIHGKTLAVVVAVATIALAQLMVLTASSSSATESPNALVRTSLLH